MLTQKASSGEQAKKTPDRDTPQLPPVFKTNTYYKTQRLLDILA